MSAGKDPMGLAAAVLFASCTKTGEQKMIPQVTFAFKNEPSHNTHCPYWYGLPQLSASHSYITPHLRHW